MDARMRDHTPAGGSHWIVERTFRRGDAPEVRRFAQAFGSRAGLRGEQLPDFVLAVNEAAACAIAQWPGMARLRLWSAGDRLYCEVRVDALAKHAPVTASGGWRGEEDALRRHVLRQVCDYIYVACEPDATRVLVTMAVRRAARDPSGRAGTRRPR